MTPDIVKRYSTPVPRYTSYPTAPHFSDRVGRERYLEWLSLLPAGAKLSLYAHIPFCQEICWYCGCTTKAARRYEPVTEYLGCLKKEIANVGLLVPRDHEVGHIHWGGGSPNALQPADITGLADAMRAAFRFAPGAEFAVEIDPRSLSEEQVTAFAAAGVNRASLGVQDFDDEVQRAINRLQSYELTKRAVDLFRDKGVRSLNIDLVYGLPHQTRESADQTIEKVIELAPDRIALFGYAHLPARIKHQRLIDERALPDAVERYGQSRRMARRLEAAGYVQIGIDHFALETDALAGDGVRRNFQGYTTDMSDALLGFGASAIGNLPQGYVQNAPTPAEYERLIRERGLATVRGVALADEDRMRAFVIERLMCDFEFNRKSVEAQFGDLAAPIAAEAEAVIETDRDGLVERTADGFKVTETGKPFVRAICACFDAYLGTTKAQHAPAI